MIKWCSYCQRFMHEVEPFGLYVISHGICDDCVPKGIEFGEAQRQAADDLGRFFQTLQKMARAGSRDDRRRILAESRRLGIRPMDLMMGMLQPLLREIGDLWAQGAVTVGCEHRFSDLVRELIDHFRPYRRMQDGQTPALDLLLLPARDNTHNLGLQMAESFFASTGLAVLTLLRGIPTMDLIELLAVHRPRAVGFSVALPDQLAQVGRVAEAIQHLRFPPQHILLGGVAARTASAAALPPGVRICRDTHELRELQGLLEHKV